MRQVIDPQLRLGEQDISAIELDPRSGDDIPRILRALQYIYTAVELRKEEVLTVLAEVRGKGARLEFWWSLRRKSSLTTFSTMEINQVPVQALIRRTAWAADGRKEQWLFRSSIS